MMPRASSRVAVAGAVASFALGTGCYTTTNVATLAPLHTAYPVSASSQYVDQRGQIVTDADYEVIQPFSFTRVVQTPTHSATLTPLAFEPDLDRIVGAAHGDAITGMTVAAQDYDVGSHGTSAGWKIFGWGLGMTGVGCIAAGAVLGDDPKSGTQLGTNLVTAGVVTAGVGVLSYLIGAALNQPAAWHLEVSGKIVKRTGPAVQATLPRSASR